MFSSKKDKDSKELKAIISNLEKVEDFLKSGDFELVSKFYSFVKREYNFLEEKEKKEVYSKILKLQNKIYIREFLFCLNKLDEVGDENYFLKLDSLFESLDKKTKAKLSKRYSRLKKDFVGKNNGSF